MNKTLLMVIAAEIIFVGFLFCYQKTAKVNQPEQTIQSQVYHADDTVWIKRNGEILKGELTHSPER